MYDVQRATSEAASYLLSTTSISCTSRYFTSTLYLLYLYVQDFYKIQESLQAGPRTLQKKKKDYAKYWSDAGTQKELQYSYRRCTLYGISVVS